MTRPDAGRISLSAAILGLLVGVLLPIGYAFVRTHKPGHGPFFLWLALVTLLESVALAYGVRARQTDHGLAGLTLACAVFLLLFCMLW